ncbi:MAG: SMC-Scp complex subunit ScpB [Planctomycetaceae bacterium]
MNGNQESDPMDPSVAGDEAIFSEQAIEEAYLQALRASEEAGLMPELPDFMPAYHGSTEDMSEPCSAEDTSAGEAITEPATSSRSQFTPQQIIEVLLFVGGEKFSAKRIAALLGQHCTEESVRNWIEEITARYEAQGRPYEIVLGEDGYQLSLREPYQTQRHLLFGLGPREVKLSQEVLEVLAFIAYQQPVTQAEVEEIDRPNVLASLRQLVRRELVVLERTEAEETPRYRTTPAFCNCLG